MTEIANGQTTLAPPIPQQARKQNFFNHQFIHVHYQTNLALSICQTRPVRWNSFSSNPAIDNQRPNSKLYAGKN